MTPGFTEREIRAADLRRHELLAEVARARFVRAHVVVDARHPCLSPRRDRPDLRPVRAFLARLGGQPVRPPAESLAPPPSL